MNTLHNLFSHYRRLWFFNFNRFKGNNYQLMREYFAHLLIDDLDASITLQRKTIVDVGGAEGEFCDVLSRIRECDAYNLDPGSLSFSWPKTIRGRAEHLPFKNDSFDVVICRGVLEHIPPKHLPTALEEMYRINKSGGICYLVIPPWYTPHAGHQLKPFHLLPFRYAKRLRELFFREKIEQNSFEELNLYKITVRGMLNLLAHSPYQVLKMKDVHFRLHGMTKIPLLRELFIPSVAFILRKKSES